MKTREYLDRTYHPNSSPKATLTNLSKDKQVEVVKLFPPILARPSKKTLEKSKFFNKKDNIVKKTAKPKTKQLYAQELAPNIGEILELKENFPIYQPRKSKIFIG